MERINSTTATSLRIMSAESIRAAVEGFRIQTGSSASIADCFPAWYLSREFKLGTSQGFRQSSDPALEDGPKGYDLGLDAFHVERSPTPGQTRVVLIQSKFSSSV